MCGADGAHLRTTFSIVPPFFWNIPFLLSLTQVPPFLQTPPVCLLKLSHDCGALASLYLIAPISQQPLHVLEEGSAQLRLWGGCREVTVTQGIQEMNNSTLKPQPAPE